MLHIFPIVNPAGPSSLLTTVSALSALQLAGRGNLKMCVILHDCLTIWVTAPGWRWSVVTGNRYYPRSPAVTRQPDPPLRRHRPINGRQENCLRYLPLILSSAMRGLGIMYQGRTSCCDIIAWQDSVSGDMLPE